MSVISTNMRRHAGIEWLRIWAMFFITFGHLVGFANEAMLFTKGATWHFWFMSLGGGAVDCFILITGYFGVRKERAIVKALSIYVETVFYGIFIALLFLLFGWGKHPVEPVHFIKSAIPLLPTSFNYWFITKYIGLMLLAPWLDLLMKHLTKRQQITFTIVLLFLNLSLFIKGAFPWGNQFGGAWTLMWFICLYVCGHFIRTFESELIEISLKKWLGCWLSLYVVSLFYIFFNTLKWIDIWSYNSVFVFAQAVCAFMIALRFRDFLPKIVFILSPGVFAVYIIHGNYFIRNWLSEILLPYMDNLGMKHFLWLLPLTYFIFAICFMADYLRRLLFNFIHMEKILAEISAPFNSFVQHR